MHTTQQIPSCDCFSTAACWRWVVGPLWAVGLNIDAVQVTRTLYTSTEKRARVLESAERFLAFADPDGINRAAAADSVSRAAIDSVSARLEELAGKLPLVFRTLRGEKLSPQELDQLAAESLSAKLLAERLADGHRER